MHPVLYTGTSFSSWVLWHRAFIHPAGDGEQKLQLASLSLYLKERNLTQVYFWGWVILVLTLLMLCPETGSDILYANKPFEHYNMKVTAWGSQAQIANTRVDILIPVFNKTVHQEREQGNQNEWGTWNMSMHNRKVWEDVRWGSFSIRFSIIARRQEGSQ